MNGDSVQIPNDEIPQNGSLYAFSIALADSPTDFAMVLPDEQAHGNRQKIHSGSVRLVESTRGLPGSGLCDDAACSDGRRPSHSTSSFSKIEKLPALFAGTCPPPLCVGGY